MPIAAGNELSIAVTADDFQAADAETRAIETEYKTTFVEGDKIGVYVIAKDGKVLVKNRVLTRDAEGIWGGNKLYYYKMLHLILLIILIPKILRCKILFRKKILCLISLQS